jgi:alpha-beta hydrolase superfamily lysophospholipase
MNVKTSLHERLAFKLSESGQPVIAVQVQRPDDEPRADVVFVHGATFGADLSVYFPFDGRSWADALVESGFAVWGFDFVGYGNSDRYPREGERPAGALDDALGQLQRVVGAIRQRNGNRPIALLAHSRGGVVAARYAGEHGKSVAALALFAPIVTRAREAGAAMAPIAGSHYPLTAWAQYRRFIEDVPRGEPQVLSEAHMNAWAHAFLASDPTSTTREPPSVWTPAGPRADSRAMLSGQALYDLSLITCPTLLVRGEWDSLCTDTDAARVMAELAVRDKHDVKIARATHLMHLERQRVALYDEVNRFLSRVSNDRGDLRGPACRWEARATRLDQGPGSLSRNCPVVR